MEALRPDIGLFKWPVILFVFMPKALIDLNFISDQMNAG